MERARLRIKELEDALYMKESEYNKRLAEMESRIVLLTTEIEKLNSSLR